MIILDLETDGLLPTVTKIHCASALDTDTGEIKTFRPHEIDKCLEFIDSCPELSCHNGIGFDLPVLKKLLNYEYKGRYVDTLLLSRILFPDIDPAPGVKGRHSVEAWGVRFNLPKPEHEDWSVFSEEMLHRNVEDTKIQAKIYKHCIKHLEALGLNINTTIDLEQKVWEIIEIQALNGWKFDSKLADSLIVSLTNTVDRIEKQLKPLLNMRVIKPYKETPCKAFKANGELTKHSANWVKDQFETVTGDFCRVQFELVDINSSNQLKEHLFSKGWIPQEWNYKKDNHGKPIRGDDFKLITTSPKLPRTIEDWDNVATQINCADIILIAEYNKAQHRRSQIEGLLNNVRKDNRIEAQAITCSTNTARMVHRTVVNIPKALDTVYYGTEMRSLFIAPERRILVGADASALEARCEAHYVFKHDPASAMELIDGDIHTRNAELFNVARNIAKNGKYAILYGCSPGKLASTLGKPISMATELYSNYWDGNPGIKQLKEELEKEYEDKKYITAIDGRPLSVRYKHALINTLFQSCGSIIMKLALCILDKWLKTAKIKYMFIGNFHDEFCIECDPEDAEFIGDKAIKSMEKAGQLLKLNVPITGEYKIGKNWAEIH